MSYNGIGLKTARGSGTNGYVQKNIGSVASGGIGHYERRQLRSKDQERSYIKSKNLIKINQERDENLLLHNRKRDIEVKCMQLREKLEDEDELDDEAIDMKVDALRKKLLTKLNNNNDDDESLGIRNKNFREKRDRSLSPTGPRDKYNYKGVRKTDKSKEEARDFINSFKVDDSMYD
ncbi:hypothetical protein PACTADRAFT_5251 [Pachysolen tannophilus NRRL Y-2460]|uniref:Pre-mRNA-splicing factor CWC21 n=1 Tax=Pachysolen tannophilus NRRL Y-2460 TaxID=669874 RepID=A0A1E4TNY2_PACTA|nr:hypothetical protein PACTADRAFT_5251 [Pachysolen tannophilus NRRL Y-2460]